MEFPAYFDSQARVTPAAAHGFQTCAAVLMQLLVMERGRGPWVLDLYEKLRAYLEAQPMPEDQEGIIEPSEWHETALMALDNVFAHRLLVDGDDIEF